jgi:pimeloyl-ACP methyl ester carboxylesterase
MRLLVSYDDVGRGEPALLLLPGWCGDRSVYLDLARHLARRFRVLTLDWRGHGRSPAATGEIGEAELVEDALAVIERSGARLREDIMVGMTRARTSLLVAACGSDGTGASAFYPWNLAGTRQ